MKGRLISVSIAVESSIFAFSAASSRRCFASASLRRSMPCSFAKSSASQLMIFWSMSFPPRCASPSVDFTSMTSSPTSRTEMSNVPPPKSKTTIFSSFFLLKPYARAAAVGSLMMRSTSRPAILPASFVACRWESLKYAGTVMTACVTFSPRRASASVFNFWRIIAEISSGRFHLSPSFTSMPPVEPFCTSKGTAPASFWTAGSSKLWPMNRLIWKIVFFGLVTACRFASWPASRSPDFESATMEGVVRAPSAFSRIFGSPASITATAEFVVPRSIPMILDMCVLS